MTELACAAKVSGQVRSIRWIASSTVSLARDGTATTIPLNQPGAGAIIMIHNGLAGASFAMTTFVVIGNTDATSFASITTAPGRAIMITVPAGQDPIQSGSLKIHYSVSPEPHTGSDTCYVTIVSV